MRRPVLFDSARKVFVVGDRFVEIRGCVTSRPDSGMVFVPVLVPAVAVVCNSCACRLRVLRPEEFPVDTVIKSDDLSAVVFQIAILIRAMHALCGFVDFRDGGLRVQHRQQRISPKIFARYKERWPGGFVLYRWHADRGGRWVLADINAIFARLHLGRWCEPDRRRESQQPGSVRHL